MLTTGHCSTHPSREAELRCRSCRKWLCDRCVKVYGGYIYCGQPCHLRQVWGAAIDVARKALGRRVAPAWSIAVAGGSAALLLTAVGLRVAELLDLSAWPDPGIAAARRASPPVSGRLEKQDGAWQVEIEGAPGTAVLLIADGQPLEVVLLDGAGRGVATGLDLGSDPRVDVITLGRSGTSLAATTPRPTATKTNVATVRATPPAAAARQSTPRPSATARAVSAAERRVRRSAPPVLHLVHDAGSRIALTFDGGSSSNGTTELLALLKQLDLRVTMFLTGGFIEENPALVRRALLEGHEVGNHLYSHPRLTSYADNRRHDRLPHVTQAWFEGELLRTEAAFHNATGQWLVPLWRAPYGEENATVRGWAADLGYLHVRWSSLRGASLDAWDWVNDEHNSLYQDSSRMVDRLLSFPRLNGGIVLMHLASERARPPWEALPEFVAALERRGIETVTATALIERSRTWRGWLRKVDKRHRKTVEERIRPR